MFNNEIENELDRLVKLYRECKYNLDELDEAEWSDDEDVNFHLRQDSDLWLMRLDEVRSDILVLLTDNEDFVETFLEMKECFDNSPVCCTSHMKEVA